VNSQPIKKHFLKNGDVVELGKYKLKYIVEATSAGRRFERSTVPEPNAPAPQPPESAPPPEEAPAPAAVGVIQVLNGAKTGRELELTKTLTTLGKPGRQVAVIAHRAEGYFLTHVEGASFPIVNGQTLDVQAYPLKEHDVIEIGGIKMEFFLKR
jgi:hypothetical protein